MDEPIDHNPAMAKAIWAEIRRQGEQQKSHGIMLDRLLSAVTRDPLDRHGDPGIVQVQEDHGRRIDDVKARVTNLEVQHESNLEKINAARAAEDERQGDRTWTMGWDALKLGLAAAAGAISGVIASKPPGHP